MKKASRLITRIEEFRAWWLGLDSATRRQNEARLQRMGELGAEIIGAANGEDFGKRFWAICLEAGKGFIMFGKEPPELLYALKQGMPELWPVLAPFLPYDILEAINALEAAKR